MADTEVDAAMRPPSPTSPAVVPIVGAANSTADVLKLGGAFMLLFTAFQTSGFFQATILRGLGFGADLAYGGLALLYVTLALCIFVAPWWIEKLTARRAIFVGACMYCIFIGSLIHVNAVVYLLASMLNGFGASLLWTSQGSLLTQYSSEERRNRNSSLFWSMLQTSLLNGSITACIVVPAGASVTADTAQTLYIVLFIVAVLGTGTLLTLGKPPMTALEAEKVVELSLMSDVQDEDGTGGHGTASTRVPTKSFIAQLRSTCGMLRDSRLRTVAVLVAYSGVELTFWAGKYAEMVGGEDQLLPKLPESFEPRLIAFVMMCFGLSQIVGALAAGRMADVVGGTKVLGAAITGQLICFILIAVNMYSGWMTPSVALAFFCAILLGVGDATVNTMMYAILGRLFKSGDSRVFAWTFFFKSAFAGTAFSYSSKAPMLVQLGILFCGAPLAFFCYRKVDRSLAPQGSDAVAYHSATEPNDSAIIVD